MKREEKKERNTFLPKKGGRKFLGTLLSLLTVVFLGTGILMTSGIDAKAQGNKPAGGLAQRPEVEAVDQVKVDSGVTVFEDDIEPKPLDVILDTGEHYKVLSPNEKVLYRAIYNAITAKKYIPYAVNYRILGDFTKDPQFRQYAYVYDISTTAYSFTPSEYNHVAEAVAYDHADQVEYFMCFPQNVPSFTQDGKVYNCILMKSYYDENQYASLDAQLATALNNTVNYYKNEGFVIDGIEAYTEYNIYFTHYADSITYDYEGMNVSFDLAHTAYGALVDKSAVCDGYSTGFQLIMEKLGIESRVVTGDADGGTGEWGGHAWNMVKLDGAWYDVDTTWGSNNNNTEHFNKTTQQFNADHRRDKDYLGSLLPVATGTHWTFDYIYHDNKTHEVTTAVTGVSVTAPKTTIGIDENVVLDIAFAPANASNQKYTVTSSNPAVAYVSGDAVTGMSVGTAVITVTTDDGGKTATLTINVVASTGQAIFDSEGNAYQVISDGAVELKSAGYNKSGTVAIPESILINEKVYKVTKIANGAFKNNKEIKSITGGNNITTIGNNAFSGCTKLTSVNISSNNLKTIGKKAFYKCKKLKKVTLNGSKLKSVKSQAFGMIKSGAKIYIKTQKSKFAKLAQKLRNAGASSASFKRK